MLDRSVLILYLKITLLSYYFSSFSSDKFSSVYHSTTKSVKKSKSHGDKLGRNNQHNEERRYSSADVSFKRHEFGVSGSNSFQENLSKICECTDDTEEEEEKKDCPTVPQPPEAPSEVTDDSTTDENKNRTVKGALSSASSFDSDDAPTSRKASVSDDDAAVTFEPASPKKKSGFEKTKSKIHKGFKRLSITESLFSNAHVGRRMSLPVFSSLPDFKMKSPSVKSPHSVDKSVKSPEEDKAVPTGPTYVNMVEDKPELFVPLDSK